MSSFRKFIFLNNSSLAILYTSFYFFLISHHLLQAAKPCSELPFEVVAEGFKFPEGPAFDSEGNLYVVAYREFSEIGIIKPDGTVEAFMDLGSEGAPNGMAFSPDGRIFACEYEGDRIVSIDLATKEISTVVDSFNGKPLSDPNDIFLCENGDIYFTDPYREDATTGGRVFVYSQKEKKLYLLVDGLAFPNGLTVSRDRKTLYVAQTVRRNVTAYPLSEDGHSVEPGREIFLMAGGNGPDGIEEDENGNLYVTHYGAGRVYLISPEGILLGCAMGFGKNVTNVEIHGEWLYITEPEKGQVLRIRRELFTAP